jgi:hypothetical protein
VLENSSASKTGSSTVYADHVVNGLSSGLSEQKTRYAFKTSWKGQGCADGVVAYPNCGNRLSYRDRASPLIIALQLQREQYKSHESRTSSDGIVAVQDAPIFPIAQKHTEITTEPLPTTQSLQCTSLTLRSSSHPSS